MEGIRVTITLESDEQVEKLLDVIGEAEAQGELDFAFEVRTDRWMGGFWAKLDKVAR